MIATTDIISIVSIVGIIFFFFRHRSSGYIPPSETAQIGRSLSVDHTLKNRGENIMQKKDQLYLEELRYVGMKEAQGGNEVFNTFYMFILIITIIGAAVSQLVSVHFQIKNNISSFEVSPFAIDAVTCILLLAGFIFSCICFHAYFQIAQNQIDFIKRREKIKKGFEITPKELRLLETATHLDVIPSLYIRFVTVLAGSLCLAGATTVCLSTVLFAFIPCFLYSYIWGYQILITLFALLITANIFFLYLCLNSSLLIDSEINKNSTIILSKSLQFLFSLSLTLIRRSFPNYEPSNVQTNIPNLHSINSKVRLFSKSGIKIFFSNGRRNIYIIVFLVLLVGVFGLSPYFLVPHKDQVSCSYDPLPASQIYILSSFIGGFIFSIFLSIGVLYNKIFIGKLSIYFND